MPRTMQVGATSQTIYVVVLDSTSTVGAGLSGLAYNTASLTAYYVINGSASVAITLVAQTASGAWSSGGFAEVDSTHAKGLYRLDIPNAAIASGASVVFYLQGATNMVPVAEEVQLVGSSVDVTSINGVSTSAVTNVLPYIGGTGDSFAVVNSSTFGNAALLTAIDEIGTLGRLVAFNDGPISPSNAMTLAQGYDYNGTLGNAKVWNLTGFVSISGATVTLVDHASGATLGTASIVTSGAPPTVQVVSVAFTASQTSALTPGTYVYVLKAVLGGGNLLLATGPYNVLSPY